MKLLTRIAAAIAGLLVVASLPAASFAQGYGDSRPRFSPGSPRMLGGVPGRFDYYALVLSWSPTWCAESARSNSEPQCTRRNSSNRPYSFVLHGLWPQYERGFPNSCPTPERPFVPDRTINGILDIMPSRPLVIHEYRKHGVCSGLSPEGYFDLARKAYSKVRIPQQFQSPTGNQMIDTNAVLGAFVQANPGLKPDMLAVSCGGPGNRLREIRICMSREGEFRTCGGNENQRKLCNAPRVFVPPVRESGSDTGPQPRGRQELLRPPTFAPAPGQRSL